MNDLILRRHETPEWLRRGVARLQALCTRRPARDGLDGLSTAALKDIGLSRGDLPAVRAGLYEGDATRRKR